MSPRSPTILAARSSSSARASDEISAAARNDETNRTSTGIPRAGGEPADAAHATEAFRVDLRRDRIWVDGRQRVEEGLEPRLEIDSENVQENERERGDAEERHRAPGFPAA